jgi:Mn-dependent DtxR family transcriptional regulator
VPWWFLAEFFKMIGIDEDAVNIDAEGIEHHLYSKTLKKLQKTICLLKDHGLIGLH